ncbi:hypothetical protein DVK85_11725 [Flavobacterium arcticum]|uniref:PKD domain-containing protein n=1 Tax=Flavobacterium arcticum TaxID=1784713 RepID=A0A345HE49_9FLAO|nr:hypothetical protein [Flavobacterium arcticum]AXG74859.1 hypothetical protein DVK85_11725 [Flavobacterium arcticum]KAF2509642.1 hypothetical protein E0W72_08945 [Flavobacterium arcticum]
MKKLKLIFSILFIGILAGCSEDENDLSFVNNAPAPQNISALFTISQDNTGLVTIAPNGEGVVGFDVYYGDGTVEPTAVNVGQKTTHTYTEGQYDVTIVGHGVTGNSTEVTLPLTVTFIAPENINVTIVTVLGNPLKINVSATADYETFFDVTYGEDPAQEAVEFNEGQTVNHTYSDIGTYTVTVTAYSGGAATAVYTEEVTINNPLTLPITFEVASLNYTITDFNGNASAVIDNPDVSGFNTSSKVGAMTPGSGVFTGGFLTLDEPIAFAANEHDIKIKVWSPEAGIPVIIKIEDANDSNIFYEAAIATTTVANEWEEIVYDFSGASLTESYSRIVIFFNAGNEGNGDTYYFDDIELFNGSDPVELPLTFESPTQDITWNNFGGAIGNKIANPNASGINTTANVGEFVKNAGSETWAGIAIPMDAPIDFSTMQQIKVKVWSPQAGIPVLIKLENMEPHDTALDLEVQTTTTVANQWEEITFDFSGINNANNYQQIVLFFNFGVSGTGESYYFDDVQLSN